MIQANVVTTRKPRGGRLRWVSTAACLLTAGPLWGALLACGTFGSTPDRPCESDLYCEGGRVCRGGECIVRCVSHAECIYENAPMCRYGRCIAPPPGEPWGDTGGPEAALPDAGPDDGGLADGGAETDGQIRDATPTLESGVVDASVDGPLDGATVDARGLSDVAAPDFARADVTPTDAAGSDAIVPDAQAADVAMPAVDAASPDVHVPDAAAPQPDAKTPDSGEAPPDAA